jgi:hypothetical protein
MRAVALMAIVASLVILASRPIKDVNHGPVPRVQVLYVGANDCAPCRTWHREFRPAFVGSFWFSQLEYHEVLSATLFDVLKDENWPENLHRYRDLLDDRSGVPIWFVVANDQVVLRAGGISQWETAVLPKIESLFR